MAQRIFLCPFEKKEGNMSFSLKNVSFSSKCFFSSENYDILSQNNIERRDFMERLTFAMTDRLVACGVVAKEEQAVIRYGLEVFFISFLELAVIFVVLL